MAYLGQHDPVIAKVKEKHMKTSHRFIECVRLELKNNITKVEKEIKEGMIMVPGKKVPLPPKLEELPEEVKKDQPMEEVKITGNPP